MVTLADKTDEVQNDTGDDDAALPGDREMGLEALRDRLREERERRGRAEEDLERNTREIETIFHIISHDLREPARTVSQFAKILQSRVAEQLDDKSADFLARTRRGAERLHGQLNDLLILYRARRELDQVHVIDLDELARRTLERVKPQVDELDGEVVLVRGLGRLTGSGTWLERALVHLLDNACQHRNRSGPPPRIVISPWSGQPPRGEATRGIKVDDRGPGVDEGRKGPIFEVFRRGITRQNIGSGAGLAIVRAVAERHGGWAWVEDRTGGGSRFIVSLAGLADTDPADVG